MALDLGELQVHLDAVTSEFHKNMSGVQSSMVKMGAAMAKIGLGIATALGGVAAASGKMAVDFEKDMANVGTLLGKEGSARVEDLGDEIKKMAASTGKPLSDLAGGMYQVISAFGDGADSAKILEISAKASAAGLADTKSAVDLLSSTTKGYGDTSAAAVQKVSDLAFQTVKLGQTTFPELAASMGKAVPLAATLGVKMETLFGAMSTLTGVTGNTAEVATQLRATMQALINPSTDMQAVFDKLGFSSGKAAVESLGFQGVLNKLKEATGGNTAQLAGMFGSVEALNSVLALTGPQAADFTAKTAAMGNAAGESSAAFDIQQKSVAASMERIKQSLSVVAVNLGEQFLPILAKLGDWVAAHMPQIQAIFDKAFQAISTVINIVTEGFRYFTETIMPAFASAFESNGGLASSAMESLRDTVMPVLEKIGAVFQKAVEVILVVWREWGDEIVAVSKAAFETAWKVLGAALDVIGGILDTFIGLFTGDWSRMADGLQAIWGGLWDAVEAVVSGAWKILDIAFGALWNSIAKWFTHLVSSAASWGSDMMAGFWNGLTGWFGRISSAVENFVSSMVAKVKSVLDINSPSGVFESIGANIGAGLAEGIEASRRLVNASMASLVPPSLTGPAISLAGVNTGMSSFTGRVAMMTGNAGGFKQMTDDGQAAMAAGGAGVPEIRVFIGNREIYDLVVEANEDATRRGRV